MGVPKLVDINAQRLHVMLLETDPKHAFEDQALATMVRDGWTLFTQFAADFGPSGERIVVVLAPPRVDPNLEVMTESVERLLDASTQTARDMNAAVTRWQRWLIGAYLLPMLMLALLLWRAW